MYQEIRAAVATEFEAVNRFIIDQLHSAGVVGPADGSKPREVLISIEKLDALMRGEDLVEEAEAARAETADEA